MLHDDGIRPADRAVQIDLAASAHGRDVHRHAVHRDPVVFQQIPLFAEERRAELQPDDAVSHAVQSAKSQHGQRPEIGLVLNVRGIHHIRGIIAEFVCGASGGDHVGTVAERNDRIGLALTHGRMQFQIDRVAFEFGDVRRAGFGLESFRDGNLRNAVILRKRHLGGPNEFLIGIFGVVPADNAERPQFVERAGVGRRADLDPDRVGCNGKRLADTHDRHHERFPVRCGNQRGIGIQRINGG